MRLASLSWFHRTPFWSWSDNCAIHSHCSKFWEQFCVLLQKAVFFFALVCIFLFGDFFDLCCRFPRENLLKDLWSLGFEISIDHAHIQMKILQLASSCGHLCTNFYLQAENLASLLAAWSFGSVWFFSVWVFQGSSTLRLTPYWSFKSVDVRPAAAFVPTSGVSMTSKSIRSKGSATTPMIHQVTIGL